MRTKILLLVIFIAVNFSAFSQQPSIEWEKSLGGNDYESAASIQQTSDGGFIVAGYTSSTEGDILTNHGYNDYWVIKLNATGGIVWQRTLGGSVGDMASSVQETIDGGFIVAGSTASNDGDVSGNHGNWDVWIVKLSSIGNIDWQKCLGGSYTDFAYSISQTSDGGFICGGSSSSNDFDVSGNHGSSDAWVVKLAADSDIEWQKSLRGNSDDECCSVQQTSDGGYILLSKTYSYDGDVSGAHGLFDYWLVKLDGSGNIDWQKPLGGSDDEYPSSVQQLSDGGFVVAGRSYSNDGDVSGHHGDWGHYAPPDCWIVKVDVSGNILWQKSLGGDSYDDATSIKQTIDGGLIIGGYSKSNDGDVSGNHGNYDNWIVKLDGSGNITWQKSLGGSFEDKAFSIQLTTNGGYIMAGLSYSNNLDVTGHHGNTQEPDFWIVRLQGVTGINASSTLTSLLTLLPNPSTGVFEIRNQQSEIQNAIAFNLLGEKVFSTSNIKFPDAIGTGQISNSIDLSSQPDGVYFLHLETKEGMVVKKVIIGR